MIPKTDIVIALHATRQYPAESYFAKCIETLRVHTQNYRLILVDDACDAAGAELIDLVAKQEQCVLIKTNKQRWFTRAYNAGLRMVRTERAVLLNADVELGAGWLEELYGVWDEAASQGHNVGLVGSVLSEPEPRRWAATTEPGYVTAHCLLVSMQAVSDASVRRGQPGWYLDETQQKHIHIFSDNELSYQLNRIGYATVQSFKSAVGHHCGKSWGHDLAKVFGLKLEDVNW